MTMTGKTAESRYYNKNTEKNVYIAILGYILLYVLYYFVFTMVFSPYGLSVAATTALALAFTINSARKREKKRGIDFREALGLKLPDINKKSIFLLMLLGVGLNFTISGVLNLLPQRLTDSYAGSYTVMFSGNIYITLFVMAVVTPVLEEIFFRGIFQRRLCNKLGPFNGLIAATLLFGLMHFNVIWSIYAAVIGFFMGCLYMYYDSIIPSAIVHSLFNLISCIPVFVSEYETFYKYTFGSKIYVVVTLIVGIGIIYYVVEKTWIKKFFNRNEINSRFGAAYYSGGKEAADMEAENDEKTI